MKEFNLVETVKKINEYRRLHFHKKLESGKKATEREKRFLDVFQLNNAEMMGWLKKHPEFLDTKDIKIVRRK